MEDMSLAAELEKLESFREDFKPPENEVDFSIVQKGITNNIEIVPPPKSSQTPLITTLPSGIPPVLPHFSHHLEEFLTDIESLPIHDLQRAQKWWPREATPAALYHIPSLSCDITLQVERHLTTGELLDFKEVHLENSGSTAKNSFSLTRQPGPPTESVRGSSTNFPFLPGGFENLESDESVKDDASNVLNLESELLTVPPGFDSGMTFGDEGEPLPFKTEPSLANTQQENVNILNVADLLSGLDEIEFLDEAPEEPTESEKTTETDINLQQITSSTVEDIPLIANNTEVLSISETPSKALSSDRKGKWAVEVDMSKPVSDFHRRIPRMAYQWPFELDTFQKQAVLCLENHDSVFVAAHTSAGKTVVAEYAIALALKNMTRVVYTSPIKALSNQKFRDFKQTFENVGLITGDVQIKPESACLIMTTEILRSILYNGADLVRDLEWVIFDEVHYINDESRGVVWEEVLILLPEHVSVILLSATVPNTMQFAEWVGRIKKKKIYVISTLKRPVPLEHYLYTGNSTKTSNELFMIIDSQKNFLTKGYNQAVDAKKQRETKASGYGAKGFREGNTKTDRNVYLSVMHMLEKKEQLPVVCFTLSKRRCDDNAVSLLSRDLTTSEEKNKVHLFIKKCVARLKGTDKQLPQVLHMSNLLQKGIGVHHSGILPILKEVVEMLFQKGLVKVLFATETFAMGVNMPARTVVFDSIRKHDGTTLRHLNPGEYIQMAGRAGRRGLDTTGTVIILCKGDVPEMSDLHKMMLGKPTMLASQFRLTYTMILHVLRVSEIRVEDMMRRSFLEFDALKAQSENKEKAKKLSEELQKMEDVDCYLCNIDLKDYYSNCKFLTEARTKLQTILLTHPAAIKSLVPGRVIIVNNAKHKHALGVVLKTPTGVKKKVVVSLVICEEVNKNVSETESKNLQDESYIQPIKKETLFHPEGQCGHVIEDLGAEDIFAITHTKITIKPDAIIDNYNKRKIPRFSQDPPGQSTVLATQELLRLTEASPEGLETIDAVKDLHIRDLELVEQFKEMENLELTISSFECLNCSQFDNHFSKFSKKMKIFEEQQHFNFLSCDDSLQLIPEYHQRIAVLQELGHVNKDKALELKGRVACEMNNHELVITELVFRNILSPLEPTEIAALLSCMVFQEKRCNEPKLTDSLKEGVEKIKGIAEEIGEIQYNCQVKIPPSEFVEQYRFGLTEVVYQWAKGMPFAEITNLTDVSEGIIVRTIQRLDEILKDVRNASHIVGDPTLQRKMEDASQLIKRDIVFAASLYTQ